MYCSFKIHSEENGTVRIFNGDWTELNWRNARQEFGSEVKEKYTCTIWASFHGWLRQVAARKSTVWISSTHTGIRATKSTHLVINYFHGYYFQLWSYIQKSLSILWRRLSFSQTRVMNFGWYGVSTINNQQRHMSHLSAFCRISRSQRYYEALSNVLQLQDSFRRKWHRPYIQWRLNRTELKKCSSRIR